MTERVPVWLDSEEIMQIMILVGYAVDPAEFEEYKKSRIDYDLMSSIVLRLRKAHKESIERSKGLK